ncbi:MAG TPA: thioredoxin domain-containing protein [Pyrinomonadaceae bacterium]|nr:thioredoxin domain-containing protein [Pyrinomonadaceae bacterium]
MKINSNVLIIGAGLLAGLLVGVLVIRSKVLRPSEPPERIRDTSQASRGAEPPRVRGAVDAPVTLEEFADFQCPPCARFYPELKKIEAEYGTRLRVVFRHYPLEMHEHADEAAQAAEAAGAQGRFWEMHDKLYERQDEWSKASDASSIFTKYAQELGLDLARFNKDMESIEVAERIRLDRERGESIEIDGTPSLFINGREIASSARTPEGIRATIDAALKAK